MSTKKNEEVYLDYPDSGVVRPYIEKHESKMEIHDYGSGLNFISKDEHGCSMDEAWIPTYRKHNGTLVHGHCRRMNTPLTKDEIHAMYSPSEWKEVERNNRKWRTSNRTEKRKMR